MNLSVTSSKAVATLYAKLNRTLDTVAATIGYDGYGILGDTSTQLRAKIAQRGTYFQVSPGKFVTPSGMMGSLSEAAAGLFPHSWEPGSQGVILAHCVQETITGTDKYGREVPTGTNVKSTCTCISLDDYGDNADVWYPTSVVLGVYSILEGVLTLDETQAVVKGTRRAAGAADRHHKDQGYPTYSTDLNAHGTQLDELYSGSMSLLKQMFDDGFILNGRTQQQNISGTATEVEITAASWRIDYLGNVTGVPGTWYAVLPSTPIVMSAIVDATYITVPAYAQWLEKTNVVTTDTPKNIVVKYTFLPDFDSASPITTSAIRVHTNSTKIAVSGGKIVQQQSPSILTRGLDSYGKLTIDQVDAFISSAGSLITAPEVLETASVTSALSGTSLTTKTTFATPSQVSFAVRSDMFETAQEPPRGSLKVTSTRFIGTSNLTFTVSNDEESVDLSASVGNTVILTSTKPLHPCGYLKAGDSQVQQQNWRRIDDYTVAILPKAHKESTQYTWILPAGESPRWLGRSIKASGSTATPGVQRGFGYIKISTIPEAGDSVTAIFGDYQETFTYGESSWASGETIKAVAYNLAAAISKSSLTNVSTLSMFTEGGAYFLRTASAATTTDVNAWTLESTGSALQTKSPYGAGPYVPTSQDLIGMGISVIYQQNPYVQRPRINIYATKALSTSNTATEQGKFWKILEIDASDKKTVWRSHTMSRNDLVLADYGDRTGYNLGEKFSLNITVSGYDVAGAQITDSVTFDDVDAWSPPNSYSDLGFKSTAKVFTSLVSWVVTSKPPSLQGVDLYVMYGLYDRPRGLLPISSFRVSNGTASNLKDSRVIRIGTELSGVQSGAERMQQAMASDHIVLSAGGLL